MVNDPSYIQKYKAIKPRRLFYSPIGDGVVEADGVEMKRPPPDLTPKREVIHQRVVEYQRGKPGHRVIENMWDTGGKPSAELGTVHANACRHGWWTV